MAISAWPFENADTSETQYSYLFREFQDPGVVGQPGDAALQVTTGAGLSVTVRPGRAFARGYMLAADADEALPLSAAHGTLSRVDRIVFRFDPIANAGTLAVREGSPGSSSAPSLTQTDTLVYEVSLARVTVPAGATTLSASNIVDERQFLGRRVGHWTTANRPPASRGRLGFNDTTGVFEYHNGTQWRDLLPTLTWGSISGKPTTSTLDGRTLFVATSAPTASQGVDGDIYFQAV